MRKEGRLAKARDFAAVRRNGRSWSDKILVLQARPNDLDISRVGFSVSSRVGNAVTRNKVKRRLREAVRRSGVQEGWDLVLIARKDAAAAGFGSLSSSMIGLLERADLLTRSDQSHSPSPKTD